MNLRLFASMLAGIGCMANSASASEADDFDRTVAALGAGASNHPTSTQHLRAAGAALAAIGARPIETEDLALAWQHGASALPLRGRALGPGYRRLLLEPRASLHLEQTFLAGQRAQIEVVAWEHASFLLEIRDDEGKAVCMVSRSAKCDWLPTWTTRYAVHLSNPGARAATYFLVIE